MIQIGVKLLDRKGDATDFVEFELSEVNFIDLWSATNSSAKVPCHHTTHGSYLSLQTLRDITQAYEPFGFSAYDQSTVVNENQILDIEPLRNGTKVIFKDGSHTIIRKKI
ncbi:LytTR family transcriptional regulator [Paenibacillus polymyxa]|nr:LytTR family transcriptional regulator [Paenibacillus polymyxa]